MNTRRPIRKQILVSSLNETGQRTVRQFTIDKVLSTDGASSVCYEAHDAGSGRGVLKEFYPLEVASLIRDEEEQLYSLPVSECETELFEKGMEQYLASYRNMLGLMQDAPSAQQFASFIPPFEIYRGCNRNGEHVGTAYVWLPVPEYTTFDKVCDGIRQEALKAHNAGHALRTPQHKLVLLLKSVCELADCVLELHKRGMLHRDIKPRNFGFVTRNAQLLEQTLSFFDLDSLCSLRQAEGAVYSEGYADPDVLRAGHIPGIHDDIYAIGATLFRAVIVGSDPEQPLTYQPDLYPRLAELVENSLLVKSCSRFTHPKFRHQLTEILRRCFCRSAQRQKQRYESAVELKADLHRLLTYVMPVKPRDNGTWLWKEAEKKLDKRQDELSRLALQYHLYRHPLHHADTDDEINVLIMGFGYYGQQFADSCLQAGQLADRRLRVTVVSEDPLDRAVYLEARPELSHFFDVDGSLRGDTESYGTLTFVNTRLTFPREQEETRLDEDSWLSLYLQENRQHKPHYVFIALGNDRLNLEAARLSSDLTAGDGTAVSFAWEGERLSPETAEGLLPVYVSENVRREKGYAELERMAFNVHLLWEKNMNVDFEKLKKQFDEPYYHKACIDCVLSLKGKLSGFGIDPDRMTAAEAAKEYAKLSKEAEVRQKTIWLEHRRWVTAMICDGWRSLGDLQECASLLNHQDRKSKRHACIRRSSANQNLRDGYFEKAGASEQKRRPDQALWNGTGAERALYETLDPLDRMSLDLHRVYFEAAQKQKKDGWEKVAVPQIAGIERQVRHDPQLFAAWREYRACIQDIWHGQQERIYHHDALRDAFTEKLDPATRALIGQELDSLDTVLSILIKSAAYRDFKYDDVKIVDQIPFILTYNPSCCMAIPYQWGDLSQLFGNVAAPLVVNPSEIVYLCYLENRTELNRTLGSLPYVFSLLERKNIRASVAFMVVCTGTIDKNAVEDIARKFREAGDPKRTSAEVCYVKECDEAVAQFQKYLRRRKKRNTVYTLEKNDSRLSWLLRGAGAYKSMDNYRFNIAAMSFQKVDGCQMYAYITKKPSLSVADITAMKKTEGQSQPELFDLYAPLWKKSRENRGSTWKKLCGMLKDHAEKNDLIASFPCRIPDNRQDADREYEYTIPVECVPAVDKILTTLAEYRLVVRSGIAPVDTENCTVTITDRLNNRRRFDKLFIDRNKLLREKDIELIFDGFNVRVMYNDLFVNGVSLVVPGDDASTGAVASLVQYLVDKECLLCCESAQGKYSFAYASPGIKDLLTMEGRILEVYVYHKLKGSVFDDVVTGYEISWEDADVKNEFDCIATKDFSSLFIECKARADLNQDFYFKLTSLVEHFGINAKAVLIADTQEFGFRASQNSRQRSRGRSLDVVTIWKEEEIRQIDRTLLRVLNNTYHSDEA